jgi:hypothetical protein
MLTGMLSACLAAEHPIKTAHGEQDANAKVKVHHIGGFVKNEVRKR